MIEPRARRDPESLRAPDLRQVLDRFAWHEQAACAGTDDHFPDLTGVNRTSLASGAVLLPLLVCAGCPVRKPCLSDALGRHLFTHEADRQVSESRVVGIWGATTTDERAALDHLPVAEAVEMLEATLPDRLAARVAAWRQRPNPNRATKKDRRITELLEPQLGLTRQGCLPR